MKIGQYDLYSIETSEFCSNGGAMFGIIPKILWKEKLSPDKFNRLKTVTTSLLLVSDDLKAIICTHLHFDHSGGNTFYKNHVIEPTFPTHAHLPVSWVIAYNSYPTRTISENSGLFKKVYDEEWILFFEHDPIHQSCTVKFDGKHYRLNESINISE